MPPKQAKKDPVRSKELKAALRKEIENFDSAEPDQVLLRVKNYLSAIFDDNNANSVNRMDWASNVGAVFESERIHIDQKHALYEAFVKFTTNHEILRSYLKFIIDNPDENRDDTDNNLRNADDDVDENSEDNAAQSDTSRPTKTWQEVVGRNFLRNTPSLITPELQANTEIDVDRSVLKLAVLNQADWVLPPTVSGLSVGDQTKIKEILKNDTPNESLLETAVRKSSIKVIQKLIRLLKSVNIDQNERGGMLHTAIKSREASIVRLLVNEYPELVEQMSDEGLSALQVLEKRTLAGRESLKEFLVSKIVRRINPALVKKLLDDPNSPSFHLYADLSEFNYENNNFDRFLAGLEGGRYKINFYSTLLYVRLPRLGDNAPNLNRREVFTVLDWLRQRSVREILVLHVPDALQGPHQDESMEEMLSVRPDEGGFSIETLKWERLDLSLDTIKFKVVHGLQNVFLYTENWNTLAFWTGPEGLCSKDYDHIREATITIIYDNSISKARAEFYRDQAETRRQIQLQARRTRIEAESRKPPELTIHLEVARWASEDSGVGSSDTHTSNKVTPRQIVDLDQFLRQDPRPIMAAQEILTANAWPRPTRVAIIDNGIDAGVTKIWDRVAESKSFVEDDTRTRESTAWLASHPHGTQMASIVVDIDPRCLLYIAKVGTGAANMVNPDNIKAAIEWVHQLNVDVVVVSLTLRRSDQTLANAIHNADNNGKGPIFFCATDDVGNAVSKVYPAYLPQTISISACNRGGKESVTTDPEANYYFQGHQIHTDCLSYGEKLTDDPSGSSVATAIAAGVASLILSCRSLAFRPDGSGMTRKETVEAVFRDMVDDSKSSKYVSPGRFFRGGGVDGVSWTTDEWTSWIHDTFRREGRYA